MTVGHRHNYWDEVVEKGTPFGRIASASCVDMDFPAFIGQAARRGVNIMLVSVFSTFGTRPYHTAASGERLIPRSQ